MQLMSGTFSPRKYFKPKILEIPHESASKLLVGVSKSAYHVKSPPYVNKSGCGSLTCQKGGGRRLLLFLRPEHGSQPYKSHKWEVYILRPTHLLTTIFSSSGSSSACFSGRC